MRAFFLKFLSFQFSPIFNTVDTYDIFVIRVVLPTHHKESFLLSGKQKPPTTYHPLLMLPLLIYVLLLTTYHTDSFQSPTFLHPDPVYPFSHNQIICPIHQPLFAPYYTPTYTLHSSLSNIFLSEILTLFLRYVRSMKHSSSLPVFSPVL